jgi:lipopolysaccharide transport system ATP-binding protein
MSELAIRVEGLGKRYRLGTLSRYKTLRESVAAAAGAPRRLVQRMITRAGPAEPPPILWALRDVSFDVAAGDVVGIVGRNGAGKSTLLKILSRITEPTTGQVETWGRVGSLLEVGTGFHPELSGRENIFLNGAILGMSRADIVRKFDEIVEFSEVEQFLDTPVKHYSSGMYMRLAFSVAAHLEPEILVVDEVLAVGDAQFQKKCLGKMGAVAKEGRTVVFVSHNMQAVRQLCRRAILLDKGAILMDDSAAVVTERYLQQTPVAQSADALERIIAELPDDPAFRLIDIRLEQAGARTARIFNGLPVDLGIEYELKEKTVGFRIYFDLIDDDALIFRTFHDEEGDGIPVMLPGRYCSRAEIPANLLGPKPYEIRIYAGIYNVRSCTPDLGVRIPIDVEATGRYNRAYTGDTFRGSLAPLIHWEIEKKG